MIIFFIRGEKTVSRFLFNAILLLLFFNLFLFSQPSNQRFFTPDPDLRFEEVGTKNQDFSLPNAYSMVQTSDGYIWIGTRYFLYRYNGYEYETILKDKINAKINTFCEVNPNELWVGTDHGLFVLKNKTLISNSQLQPLSEKDISSIFKTKDGSIWIGTEAGLFIYKNNSLNKSIQIPSVYITGITQDKQDIIWIGTAGQGIYLLQDNKIVNRYYLRNGMPGAGINCITIDKNGNIWAGSKKGLLKFSNYKLKVYDQSSGLSNIIINGILADHNSDIWLATEGGVFLFSNNIFKKFSFPEGLPIDLTYVVFEDRENNIFVGSHTNALSKLLRTRLKLYNTRNGLTSSWAWSIIEDKNRNIWIGTNGNGVDKISNGRITNYSALNGLPANYIRSIGIDKYGDLWFGTNQFGVCRFKNNKITVYNTKNGIAGNTIRVIYSDRKGNLWIGTSAGLTKYDFKKFTNYGIKDGLPHNVIRCINEDKDGRLLLGTSNGMSIFENGKFKNYFYTDGLSDSLIFSIEVDSNNAYWIGTYNNGFNRMKNGVITRFTTDNGLINNVAYQLFISNNTDLVVSCNIGLYSMKLKDLNDFADNKIKGPLKSIFYERENSTSPLECNGGNQPSGWQLLDGKIWVSTLSGIAVIDPQKTEVNHTPPKTVIDKVFIDDKQTEVNGIVNVDPDYNFLKIEYSALSYSKPKRNKYKYMIEELDKDWIDVGTQNIAFYSNLPPGEYHFKVISSNNDGLWNEKPAVLVLNVKPYFFQTSWFYFLVITFFIGLVYIGYRFRIQSMEKREVELVNLVKERTANLLESEKMVKSLIDSKEKFFSIITHDMKNLFTALLFYSKELYNNYTKMNQVKLSEYMERINVSANSLFELFNNLLIWSRIQTGTIEFRHEKVPLSPIITSTFNSYADHSRRKNLKLENQIDNNIHVIMDRNMIMMIINNLIFNAMKLAKPDTSIKIYAENINDATLKISVENTGIPIKKEELEKIFNDHSLRNVSNTQNEWSTALGLLLCKELIEKNNGSFAVNSIPNQGNIISFTVQKG